MQIKNARAALISNYEVLKVLQERQQAQITAQKANPSLEYPEHLRTIQFELTEYLKETPCSTQTDHQVKTFLGLLSKFELTKGEKLQILNLRPKSPVEIYLIIEECEERFTEDDLEDMINIILTNLPRDDDYAEEEEEGDEEAMEEE